jgi:hypothetical protein
MEASQGQNLGCRAKGKKPGVYQQTPLELHSNKFNESRFVNIFIFRDIMPCSPLKVSRCFHLQSRRISQERRQREAGSMHRR